MSVISFVRIHLPSFLRKYAERIETSPIGYRLARGAFWSLAAMVVSRGALLLSTILVARILGKERFGELGIIQSTVNVLGVFAGFALGLTATKHIAEFRDNDPEKTGRIIAISNAASIVSGGILMASLFIFAPLIAGKILSAPHIARGLMIGSVLLFLSAINSVQMGSLMGFEAYRTIATVSLWGGIWSFPCVIFGAYFGGMEGAVWGLVGGMMVNFSITHLALRKVAINAGVMIPRRGFFCEWFIIKDFSLPALLSGALVGPAYWTCNVMLVNQPNGYGEMGVFNAANHWRAAILLIPTTMGGIVLPVLATLKGKDNLQRTVKVLKYNLVFNAGVALGLALLVSLFAPVIMNIYGHGFETGKTVLVLLCLSTVLSSTVTVIGQYIASEGKMWLGLILNLLWAVTLVVSSRILVGRGAIGLALSIAIAYGVHFVTVGIYTCYSMLDRKSDFEMS